jgi:benzoate/toluate 1,2-dioxygenase reductase subunit
VVDAFERQDKARVREVIMAHAHDAKVTMAGAIDAKAGN